MKEQTSTHEPKVLEHPVPQPWSYRIGAATLSIDTTSDTLGAVITNEGMTEIPLLSCVHTLLFALFPGVPLLDQDRNVPTTWSLHRASDIRVPGGREICSNEFCIDGALHVNGDSVCRDQPDCQRKLELCATS